MRRPTPNSPHPQVNPLSQARWKSRDKPTLTPKLARVLREGVLVALAAVALYLFISLFSYSPHDPGWSHSGAPERITNLGGRAGAWLADFLLQGFGRMAYIFPLLVGFAGWRVFRARHETLPPSRPQQILVSVGAVLTILGGCGLEAARAVGAGATFAPGGYIGDLVRSGLVATFGPVGATVFLLAMFLSGVTFFTGLSWLWLMDVTGKLAFDVVRWSRRAFQQGRDRFEGARARASRRENVSEIRKSLDKRRPPRIEPQIKTAPAGERVQREKQVPLFQEEVAGGKLPPPLSLLDPAEAKPASFSKQSLEAMSRPLEKKLRDFDIEVQVVAVHPGPVITRFEIEPAAGVKASQITGLARDIARAMSVVSVRVVENIPGKAVVGIEIPNETRETVRLVEGLSSRAYEEANTPLALLLGKDIGGNPAIADLCRMPHLLIAGTTGSGKSVCMNALILSMVYKSTPEQLRLIMIDPKMLELSAYEGIPHLLTPVVTDMKQAASALKWCIVEMERRYRLMAALGVRNVAGFNRRIVEAAAAGKPLSDPLVAADAEPVALKPLPYVVVLIDELADLMMVVGKKVEELIARLAQRARASGIHLVLATQRPSVDVITGLIKANIPARIAFQVSARVDSRTVLDQNGAEQLLGHGDMLFLPPGTGLPIRVHGAFVSDQEVNRVAAYLRKSARPDYDEAVLGAAGEGDAAPGDEMSADGETDPLYDEAVQIVIESRRASISAVQRRLRVGYNRAARMIEAMERAGVVGPLQSNGKREVLAPESGRD